MKDMQKIKDGPLAGLVIILTIIAGLILAIPIIIISFLDSLIVRYGKYLTDMGKREIRVMDFFATLLALLIGTTFWGIVYCLFCIL